MKIEKSIIQFVMLFILIIPILITADCSEPGREDGGNVEFKLVIEKIESRDQDNVTVWDVHLTINDIIPYDMEYKWILITVSVKIDDHVDIPGATPHEYENKPARFGTVAVWRDDFSGDPSTADPTDNIVITSLTEEYEGALIGILFKGDRSGWIYLPDDFITS
jgi:hypothetical protein